MNYDDTNEYKDLTLDESVDELVNIRATIEVLKQAEYFLTRQILDKMESMGSIEHRSNSALLTMVVKNTYAQNLLTPLLELEDPDELKSDGTYTPEHMELKPARWNMAPAKGGKLRKRSKHHRRIIENAKIPSQPTLKIKERS